MVVPPSLADITPRLFPFIGERRTSTGHPCHRLHCAAGSGYSPPSDEVWRASPSQQQDGQALKWLPDSRTSRQAAVVHVHLHQLLREAVSTPSPSSLAVSPLWPRSYPIPLALLDVPLHLPRHEDRRYGRYPEDDVHVTTLTLHYMHADSQGFQTPTFIDPLDRCIIPSTVIVTWPNACCVDAVLLMS